jgi:hypothetical protein
MPIEIKELLIKTTIMSNSSETSEPINNESSDLDSEAINEKLGTFKKQILAECNANMSRLLKQSTER